MFGAAKSSANRLTGYGIATRLPHTRLLFCLHNACLPHYHLAMASIASTKTQRQQMRIKNGTFDTLVHKFSGKGTFKWNAHVRALAQTLHSQHYDCVATWPHNHDLSLIHI
eukprot:2695718-Karenia_brevis.AAC.1